MNTGQSSSANSQSTYQGKKPYASGNGSYAGGSYSTYSNNTGYYNNSHQQQRRYGGAGAPPVKSSDYYKQAYPTKRTGGGTYTSYSQHYTQDQHAIQQQSRREIVAAPRSSQQVQSTSQDNSSSSQQQYHHQQYSNSRGTNNHYHYREAADDHHSYYETEEHDQNPDEKKRQAYTTTEKDRVAVDNQYPEERQQYAQQRRGGGGTYTKNSQAYRRGGQDYSGNYSQSEKASDGDDQSRSETKDYSQKNQRDADYYGQEDYSGDASHQQSYHSRQIQKQSSYKQQPSDNSYSSSTGPSYYGKQQDPYYSTNGTSSARRTTNYGTSQAKGDFEYSRPPPSVRGGTYQRGGGYQGQSYRGGARGAARGGSQLSEQYQSGRTVQQSQQSQSGPTRGQNVSNRIQTKQSQYSTVQEGDEYYKDDPVSYYGEEEYYGKETTSEDQQRHSEEVDQSGYSVRSTKQHPSRQYPAATYGTSQKDLSEINSHSASGSNGPHYKYQPKKLPSREPGSNYEYTGVKQSSTGVVEDSQILSHSVSNNNNEDSNSEDIDAQKMPAQPHRRVFLHKDGCNPSSQNDIVPNRRRSQSSSSWASVDESPLVPSTITTAQLKVSIDQTDKQLSSQSYAQNQAAQQNFPSHDRRNHFYNSAKQQNQSSAPPNQTQEQYARKVEKSQRITYDELIKKKELQHPHMQHQKSQESQKFVQSPINPVSHNPQLVQNYNKNSLQQRSVEEDLNIHEAFMFDVPEPDYKVLSISATATPAVPVLTQSSSITDQLTHQMRSVSLNDHHSHQQNQGRASQIHQRHAVQVDLSPGGHGMTPQHHQVIDHQQMYDVHRQINFYQDSQIEDQPNQQVWTATSSAGQHLQGPYTQFIQDDPHHQFVAFNQANVKQLANLNPSDHQYHPGFQQDEYFYNLQQQQQQNQQLGDDSYPPQDIQGENNLYSPGITTKQYSMNNQMYSDYGNQYSNAPLTQTYSTGGPQVIYEDQLIHPNGLYQTFSDPPLQQTSAPFNSNAKEFIPSYKKQQSAKFQGSINSTGGGATQTFNPPKTQAMASGFEDQYYKPQTPVGNYQLQQQQQQQHLMQLKQSQMSNNGYEQQQMYRSGSIDQQEVLGIGYQMSQPQQQFNHHIDQSPYAQSARGGIPTQFIQNETFDPRGGAYHLSQYQQQQAYGHPHDQLVLTQQHSNEGVHYIQQQQQQQQHYQMAMGNDTYSPSAHLHQDQDFFDPTGGQQYDELLNDGEDSNAGPQFYSTSSQFQGFIGSDYPIQADALKSPHNQ